MNKKRPKKTRNPVIILSTPTPADSFFMRTWSGAQLEAMKKPRIVPLPTRPWPPNPKEWM